MKSNVGYSTLENAFEAGKDTAEKAIKGLKNVKIGMLYTSVDYDQTEVMKGVKSVLGEDIPVVGCTSSAAIIVPDGVITSDHGFAGMLALEDESMIVAAAGSPAGKDAREIGRKVAEEALEKSGLDYAPSYYYMVASPKEEEYYAKGIQDVIGEVPFFGGSAADNAVAGDWSIFCDEKCYSDGVAVVFFYTNKPVETVFTGAFEETDHVGIVTKVNGERQIAEIDGKPALDVYASWIGMKPEELMDDDKNKLVLLARSVVDPLGVKDMQGDLIAIRHPMGTDENHVINVGAKVVPNTALIHMTGSVDGMINATETVMKDLNKKLDTPAAYLLVHCGGRRLRIDERINEVHERLVKEANGVPFITIFTFGEYGYNDHTRNTLGGLMLSFTGFEK